MGARVRLALLAAALIAPLLPFAAYLWSIGRRTVRNQRFPPPGVRVLRATAATTGGSAVTRGRVLQGLALVLGAAALALGVMLWRLDQLFAGGGL
ncbi:MAG TPA: hypothetical protein VGQ37_23815 [Vicinamibacterales bacterium]|nr:hypothetical protein [Vicinamibacterales bacterium]